MNAVWMRILRSVYRKEPISGFIMIFGVADTAIGVLDATWSLALFGLGTAGMATVLRWWLMKQQRKPNLPERAPIYALPPSSRPLPLLSMAKKQPPQ